MNKLALLLLLSLSASAQELPWLTRSHDNQRTGWNSGETILSQASVRTKGVRLATIIPVCCDARGVEAQPLIVPNLNGHDLMYLPSESNDVRAVDAHTGVSLWPDHAVQDNGKTDGSIVNGVLHLGTPITVTNQVDMWGINQHMGCMSTGVIDPDTDRAYQSCWISMDGSGNASSGRYEMFVIDLRSGQLVVPAVPLQGTDTSMWKQRSSLTLTKAGGVKTVFVPHGSIYETFTGYTGGITAFDVATNKVVANLPMTSGIWMAGQGLVADSQNYLYAITGNGDFNPGEGFYGEAFVKLRYTPSAKGSPASLAVIDDWSPWNDYQRVGKPVPTTPKLAGLSEPSANLTPVGGAMSANLAGAKLTASINEQGQITTLVYPMANGGWSDEDWGSAGPACIFSITTCIATGKDGIGYPINSYHLGQTTAVSVGTAANYAVLRSPCVWLTMSPGNVPCAPANAQTLNFLPNGLTAHLHMTPVQFYDPILKSWTLFVWGENSALHKWKVSNAGQPSYIAEGHEFASADVRNQVPGGMAGGFCTGSSNGSDPNSAIVACVIPYGDANRTVTGGRLLIYDAVHLAADGSLQVLWDSQAWGIAFMMNKFMPPVIDGGAIIVPDFGGRVLIFQ
jgi:hypothetical protein